MHIRRSLAVCTLTAAVLSAALPAAAQTRAQTRQPAPVERPAQSSTGALKIPTSRFADDTPLSGRERTLQLLDRFTFGPRPGEVDRILASGGPDAWLARQLDPDHLDDSALDRRLNDYPTLRMSPEQALLTFPDRGTIQQVAEGKRPYPPDPLLAGVYEVEVYKYLAEQDNRHNPHPDLSDAEKDAQKKTDQATAGRIAGQLFALPKEQRMAALLRMPVPDRIAFANNLGGDQRNILMAAFTPRERETVLAMQGGVGATYRIYDELAQAHVLREVLSERQLQEVMTEFWCNHFNVDSRKDSDQWYTTAYERDAIRPHALGRFRDLLLATAQSPAMMVYLDNWLSVGPDSLANGVNPRNPNSKKGNKGLNENYGREVMELHTVGVNGGYTQADVTALSAILTGWGVDRPGQAGPFQYDPRRHQPGPKTWFGYTLDDDGAILSAPNATPGSTLGAPPSLQISGDTPPGLRQGVAALILLSRAPQTAHFISFLLAQRFLADDPPAPLVDRLTRVYLQTDGDLRAILRALIASPEFNTHRFFRNKVKMPDEFLVSAFRVTATDPTNPGAMVNQLRSLGEPPYQKTEPTGYYVTADRWMNTSALVDRLNFADQLTHGRFGGQRFDSSRVLAFGLMGQRSPETASTQSPPASAQRPPANPHALTVSADASPIPGPDAALRVLESTLIGGEISPATDRYIHTQLAAQPATNPAETLNLLTALLLGSPEFQLR